MKKGQSFDITILPAFAKATAGRRNYDIKNISLSFYLSIFLLFAFCFLLFAPKALAIVNGPTPVPPYAENQVIVKYKESSSPENLQVLISQRQAKRANFLSLLSLFWENLNLRLKKQEAPETRLTRLEEADTKAGVIEKEKLFQSEEASLENFYLLKTDGRLQVEEAVVLYQSLPEVEFAEPNYIYSIMGI